MKIYGIKTCGSVKNAIKFCENNSLFYEFIDFRKNQLDDETIDFFSSKVDINLLFNNKGTKYKQLELKSLNLDDAGKLEWLKKDNMLFKRPVIVYGKDLDKVLCAYDEERYKKEFL
ncbi:MAG: arsenate reductase family protein [Epsilonproteobacteria bacterium]|nr:arsenate reductase family protein [Campylobacterota bacterium]